MRWLLLAAGCLFVGLAAYSLAVPRAQGCALTPAPTTYDPPINRAAHLTGLELAGYNMITPENTFFGIPTVETGARAERAVSEEPYIPPTLLKAIGWIESGIAQADWNTPFGAVGPALVSFDCGYGIMQITSGMINPADDGWPSLQQTLVATHYLFDIGRGAAILADKWNAAPQVRPIAGTDTHSSTAVVENWYFATWGYNGFTGPGANRSNHPSDPDYAWPRTGFSCGPFDDGYGHSYGDFPYQELVFGCAARPPSVDEAQLWEPLNLSLPNLENPLWGEPLSLENWTACSRELNCEAMDMPSPVPWHFDPTERPADGAPALLLGSPVLAASHGRVDEMVNTVTLYNVGQGILAWRAKPNQDWIVLDKQGGVALSDSVFCAPEAPCERSPTLTISVDASRAPAGEILGSVDVVSLTTGQLWQIDVEAVITPVASPTRAPTARPTATPIVTPTPTPPRPLGDADCSQSVTSVDATLILQFGAGLTTSLPCPGSADANRDGRVDARDAALVLQDVGGLLNAAPTR